MLIIVVVFSVGFLLLCLLYCVIVLVVLCGFCLDSLLCLLFPAGICF